MPTQPTYLTPYVRAAKQHGGGFRSLLWASPDTQASRFHAIASTVNLHGKSILDAGCGRADLLDYLLARRIIPQHYVGLEAVDAIAEAAEQKRHPDSMIVRADFITDPLRLYSGADVIIFCGSLNTLSKDVFYRTLRTAFDAAVEALVFNFLCSPELAHAEYLTWHRRDDVLDFARTLTNHVATRDDYLSGDCTLAMWRE